MEGHYVVVQKVEGGHRRVVKVTKKQLVLIEKLKLYLDGAIGLPFDSIVEVKQQQVTPVQEDGIESSLVKQEDQQCQTIAGNEDDVTVAKIYCICNLF